MIEESSKIKIASGYRLQWEEAQQSHVLLYPEGMIRLSDSAAAILGGCRQEIPVSAIIEQLQLQFPDADSLPADVLEFLNEAYEQHWIEHS